MTAFAPTIFLGAFLLFQVQPLIARYIVPWFGGASSVWTTCVLFFQVFLLAGYAYAYWVSGRLKQRAQGWLHLAFLAASLALLPITPDPQWKPGPHDSPVGRILLLLLSSIGVPFVVLASTGPLMQHWFSRSHPGRSPYRLYALSNTASLLALVSYPTFVEPTLTLAGQARLWSLAYALYAVLAAWCAAAVIRAGAVGRAVGPPPVTLPLSSEPVERVRLGTILLWLGLAAAGSAMLLATTNQLTQEVGSVPFLWVLPLSIYLFTFILCFDRERWYVRQVWGPLLALMASLAVMLLLAGTTARFGTQLLIYSGLLFASCMCCHGELVRSGPGPRHLTLFYLAVAAGGVVGGLFVTLIAPLVFRGFWELHVGLVATCVLVLIAAFRDPRAPANARTFAWSVGIVAGVLPLLVGRVTALWERHWPFLVLAGGCGAALAFAAVRDLARARRGLAPAFHRGALWCAVLGLAVALGLQAGMGHEESLSNERNFYGVLRVVERRDSVGALRVLINGRIDHGRQYVGPVLRMRPVAYYDSASGAGMVFAYNARRAATAIPPVSRRVGVVGLGAGALAVYGRPGDVFRFYEINPAVARVADQYFTYLKDSQARIEIALGDGRMQLEEELRQGGGQAFDVLVIDAFTSDAIPVHLLTEQCTELYLRHLGPEGLLLFHVSNRFVNLRPVIRGLAQRFGFQGLWILHGGRVAPGVLGSSWMILGRPGHPIFQARELVDSTSPFPYSWQTVAQAAAHFRMSPQEIERRVTARALASIVHDGERLVMVETDPPPVLWTDDRSSLWSLLRFR